MSTRRRVAWILVAAAIALVTVPVLGVHAVGQSKVRTADDVPPTAVALVLGAGLRPDGSPSVYLDRRLEAARDLGASRRRTFVLVTLPLSRQAILAGLVVTALPMFGDYFTNDLLSGSPRTSMVGNLVNDAIASPGQGGQAAALVLVMMALLAVPMVLYIRATNRASREVGR